MPFVIDQSCYVVIIRNAYYYPATKDRINRSKVGFKQLCRGWFILHLLYTYLGFIMDQKTL